MPLSQAILATLVYHDIFNYPLSHEQIQRYLINKKATDKILDKTLDLLLKERKIGVSRSLYYLKGRKHLAQKRILKTVYSQKKLKKAKAYAALLRLIPTIKLVALSGALAMENSHKGDDIDFVVVTNKGTLWTTRFLANLVLFPFKRDPSGKKISDRACLNLFLDESALEIKDQNLYTAHEICQTKLLWDRDGTYQRFIKANSWIKKFLPNWQSNVERLRTKDKRKQNPSVLVNSRLALVIEPLEAFLTLVAQRAEWVAKWGQLNYMASKITTEKIGDKQLFFHPSATQNNVLNKYNKLLKRLKITLLIDNSK